MKILIRLLLMGRFYNLLERLRIPRKRAFLHLLASVLSGGLWVIFAVAIEIFLASERGNKVVLNDAYYKKIESDLRFEINIKEDMLEQIEEVKASVLAAVKSEFETPFIVTDVTLWESREKITTVTTGTSIGKTRTGTVGLGLGDGIGLAASQGVTRGTFTSGTTEMMKNEFTELDSGVLRVGKEFTAFIGDQFTRTAKYPEVLSINNSYVYSIGLNVVNAERAWLIRFKGNYESNVALEMLNAAFAMSKGGQLPDLVKLENDLDMEILEISNEIHQLVLELEENDQAKAAKT